MKTILIILTILLIPLALLHAAEGLKPVGQPNVIVVLADDKYNHEPENMDGDNLAKYANINVYKPAPKLRGIAMN